MKNNITIKVLSAVPASGKTKAILKGLNGRKAIIASLSRQLSTQSYNFYRYECIGHNSVLIDTENTRGNGTVQNSIKHAIDSVGYDVIFITHAALFDLVFSEIENIEEYDLYIDETPDLIDFNRYAFTSTLNDLLLEYCEPVDPTKRGLQRLIPIDSKIDEMINNAIDGYTGNDDVYKVIFPLYQALIKEIPVLIQFTENSTYCYYVNDKTYTEWERFKSITVAASNFRDSFTGKVLKYINGWDFEESDLVDNLDFKEYKNTDRITINVMADVPWSRYTSERLINGPRGMDTVYNRIKSRLYSSIKEDEFIYTSNSYRARLDKGLEVPYNPHGLNYYTDYKKAVVLFSYNPLPWQVPLLKSISKSSGLPENELLDSYIVSKYLEPAFQLCARTNIRDNDSLEPIDLYVPDFRLANYIKSKYFKNAKISTDLMLEISDKVESNRKPTFQTMFNMTKQEIYRFNYLRRVVRKFNIDDPVDVEYVREWITHQREKHS